MKSKLVLKFLRKLFFVTFGAVIAGFALASFLSPNNIIDGGVIGVSMILSKVSGINLGLLIMLLNLPFILLAWKKMGTRFVVLTAYGNVILAISTNYFHAVHVTSDLLLATVFGGIILGAGVGTILKNEASLDGTEILSLIISRKFGFSVGEFILIINIFIYVAAGLVFSWGSAMYSVLTYFIVSRVIDSVMEGFNSSKSVRVISDEASVIGEQLIERLGGYSGEDKDLIYCVISRLELPKMLDIVQEIDSKAFVSVVDVHEVYGGKFRKKISGK